MPEAVSWATPLLHLPGAGLLLVSTSARASIVESHAREIESRPQRG